MGISRRQRLGTIVALLPLLLVGLATPALAQFGPGDLAGAWHLRGFSTDNGDSGEPGQWVSGAVTLSASGTVVSGSVTTSDGTVHPLTPGTKLTLAANGLVSGPLTWAGVPRTVRATMTFDRGAVVGVAEDAAHTINTSLALVRHPPAVVGQADLAGEWAVFVVNTPENLLPGTTQRGRFVLDATGAVVTGSLLSSQGLDEILSGGPLTVEASGAVTGLLTGTAATETATYDLQGALEPGRTMLVGVATRDTGPGAPRTRSFLIALRTPAQAFTTAHLGGVWRSYVHVVAEELEGGGWLTGNLTIRPDGTFVPGALVNPDGFRLNVVGGGLAVDPGVADPAQRVFGTMLVQVAGIPLGLPVAVMGAFGPARDRLALTIYFPIVAPGASLTLAGTATLVRQPSTVQFSAATYAQSERPGTSTALVTVTRSGVGDVAVDWATTTGGTATPGVDYTSASGTLSFTGTETTKQFTVTIQDDLEAEGQETIALLLRDPLGGAVIGPRGTAAVLVNDDEQSVEFTTDAVTVGEAITTLTLTLRRRGPPLTAFSVPVGIVGGTAVADQDYPAILQAGLTVSFAVGQVTRTFQVKLLNDTVIDGPKTLGLGLGAPQRAQRPPGPAARADDHGERQRHRRDGEVRRVPLHHRRGRAGEDRRVARRGRSGGWDRDHLRGHGRQRHRRRRGLRSAGDRDVDVRPRPGDPDHRGADRQRPAGRGGRGRRPHPRQSPGARHPPAGHGDPHADHQRQRRAWRPALRAGGHQGERGRSRPTTRSRPAA